MARFLAFAVLALLPLLARAGSYLCIEDMATGFAFRNGEWRENSFNLNTKFIVRPATARDNSTLRAFGKHDGDNAKWVVVELGTDFLNLWCPRDFNAVGNLSCQGNDPALEDPYLVEFRMNRDSLRFLTAYLHGYWDTPAGKTDTPLIAIGKCSPM